MSRDKKPPATKKKKAETFQNQPFEALKGLKKKLEEAEAEGTAKPPARPARPTRPAKPAEEPADAADALTFHRLMSGVVPLEQKRGRVPMTQPVERSPGAEIAAKRANAKSAIEVEAAEVHEHLRSLAFGASRFEVTDDGRRVEGRRVDVPPDVLRKLRRGRLPIDARLDMHGLRAGEARASLESFLRDKRARGERCVLVVHGKGEHSPNGMSVLRGEIGAWLSQAAASEHVAAFATATEDDGGEGAVYVLLRK